MPLVSKVNKKCLPIKIKGFLKPDFFIHRTSKKLGITVPFFSSSSINLCLDQNHGETNFNSIL